MKNFDVERNKRERRTEDERTCVIGGVTLVVRDRVHPDALKNLDMLKDAKLDYTTCKCTHRLNFHAHGYCTFVNHDASDPANSVRCDCKKMDPVVLEPGSTMAETLIALDQTITAYLEPFYLDAWTELRAREDDPVEIRDMMDMIQWMTAEATARPTGPLGVSSPGRLSTGTPSTDGSSLPVTPAA